MKQLFVIGLFLLATARMAGQEQNVDSLINVLETGQLSVSEQLQLYHKVAEHYKRLDPDKSLLYGNQGLRLAEKEKDKRMIANCCNSIASVLINKTSSDTVLIFLNRALAISKELKDKKIEARTISDMGSWYVLRNKREIGLEYLLQSLALYESLGDKMNAVRTMINISNLYSDIHQIEQSFNYLKRAQANMEEIDNPYIKIGIYSSLGGYYFNNGDYEKSLEHMLIVLDLSREAKSIMYEIVATQYLASIYSEKFPDYEKAERYALECLKAAESIDSKEYLIAAYCVLAKVYIDAGKYKEGRDVALKAWNMDSTTSNLAANLAAYIGISYLYLDEKDKAVYYFGKQDSLRVEEAESQFHESMSNMEVKYETEKKEIQIVTLQKERQLYLWLTVAGVLLAAVLVIVLWQSRRSIRKKRELIASKALQDGEIGERSRIAKDLHDRLGGSLSAVRIGLHNAESLQNISDKLDTCIEEVRNITNNIMPSSLRLFGVKGALEDFCTHFHNVHFHFFGENMRMNQNLEYTIYCCARELVNNSQKHSGAENIHLQLVQSKKHVSLTVQDNGCGFDEKTVIKGDGLQNIRNRVAACKGKLDIVSSPGKGTETVIEIKL